MKDITLIINNINNIYCSGHVLCGFTITETRCESCHQHVQLVSEHLQKATGSHK